jgi:uncharacterized membrane protein
MDDAPSGELLFEAAIVPHRSLSPRGLRILTLAIVFLCGLTVLRFVLIRAWPVIGFSVVEIAFAIWLLRLNAWQTRASELVLLYDGALRIVRTNRLGQRSEVALPTAWLGVLVEEAAGRVPKLLLVNRGVREEIAAQLGEVEKRDLAAALREALQCLHSPVFDNPQLR